MTLSEAMQIIDKNSGLIPEGDYLTLCTIMKQEYERQTEHTFFFDYTNFSVPNLDPNQELYTYFHEYYWNRATDLDWDFIQGQITYLEKEMFENRPLLRVTKSIKRKVITNYCRMHEGVTPETFDVDDKVFSGMCKVYMDIENQFRERYREALIERIDGLELADYRLAA